MFADDKIFKSEINPKKKNNKHKIFILIFISKAIKDKNKTTPPVNGIFKFDVNFWCLSPVKLNKKFFLLHKEVTKYVNKTETKKNTIKLIKIFYSKNLKIKQLI